MAAVPPPNVPVVPPIPPPPIVPPAPPVAPVAFARMPAEVNAGAVINFATRSGGLLFRANSRGLFPDVANNFNMKPEQLNGLLFHLDHRIVEAAWTALFMIPRDMAAPLLNLISFIMTHGTFTLEHLRLFATTQVGAQNRADQDNYMAVVAIFASLTEEAIAKLEPHRPEFTINGIVSALLLVKILIRETSVDSNVTCRIARDNLRDSYLFFKSFGFDVHKLHSHVHSKLLQLSQRGETTLDLHSFLVKAYEQSPDPKFRAWLARYLEDYDNALDNTAWTPEALMIKAGHKYQALVDEGTYNVPSKEQVKLLALESQIRELCANNTTVAKGKGGNGNKANGDNKDKPNKPQPAWMKVPPSDDDIRNNVPKNVEGKDYWWCIHHKRYVQHHSAICKVGLKLAPPDTSNDSNRSLALDTALQAEIEEGGDGYGDYE